MPVESIVRPKGGVGALIVIHEKQQFITIVELHTNRPTNKLAGQISIPMESVELGERGRRPAWRKLFKQEVKSVNFNLKKIGQIFLGQFELVPEVMVHIRAFIVSSEVKIVLGSETAEVADLKWCRFDEVLSEPKGSLRFRPGVREVVETFRFKYLANPAQFRAGICRYQELQANIPQGAFDLVDRGFSVGEALSRLGIDGRFLANYPGLDH